MITLRFTNCLRHVQLLSTTLSPPKIAVAQNFISAHKEVEAKHYEAGISIGISCEVT